jgi:hypothetical protein
MKNELSSLYEKILLNEAEKSNLQNPSNDTVGKLKTKQDMFGEKPKAVEGPDKAKVDQGPKYEVTSGSSSKPETKSSFKGSAPAKENKAEEPEEVEDDEAAPKSEEEKKQKNESIEEPISAFEALFKKTITEELGEELALEEPVTDMEDSVLADEIEDAEEDAEEDSEEGDLVSDLKHLHDTFGECKDKLASILSKLEDTMEEDSEETEEEDYSDEDFENEFEEDSEGETVKEAVEKPKALSDAHGKKLISKKNKVGKLHPKGKKAHIGSVDDEPKPKVLGDKKAHLQKVSGKPEPKSSVKKGEFFK